MKNLKDAKTKILPSTTRGGKELPSSLALDSPSFISKLATPKPATAIKTIILLCYCLLAVDNKSPGVVELTTQLLIPSNILWLPLCRIYKFGLNTLPSKTIAIPYTCGLSPDVMNAWQSKADDYSIVQCAIREGAEPAGATGVFILPQQEEAGWCDVAS